MSCVNFDGEAGLGLVDRLEDDPTEPVALMLEDIVHRCPTRYEGKDNTQLMNGKGDVLLAVEQVLTP
jgi:hypothetical protein